LKIAIYLALLQILQWLKMLIFTMFGVCQFSTAAITGLEKLGQQTIDPHL
jgi:hypothetical protein